MKGYGPTWYDVLACVAADASSATTPDEVYEDFGPMKPSTANRIAEHTHRLRRFFTEAELDRLGDVDA